jgi:RimJ/RimL family protein N-acetyltransferase
MMANFQARTFQSKNGKMFSVRTARPTDAAQLLEMGKSVMSESIYTLTEADELNLTVEQEADWIQQHNDHPLKIILVAEHEGGLAGILDFSNGHRRRISHQGEFGMSVEKAWREQGLGAALLDTLLNWAVSNPGIEKVNLRVHATNQRAIALYKKFGFEQEGLQKKDLKLGANHYVDTVLMGRFVK